MAVVDAMKEDATVISSAEQPKSDLYLNDGEKDLDEDFGVPERFRGTADDKREMSMLGKKQVLRVCAAIPMRWRFSSTAQTPNTDACVAKLSLRHHGRLCQYGDGELGDPPAVGHPLQASPPPRFTEHNSQVVLLRFDRWRYRRSLLGIYRGGNGTDARLRQSRRGGIHVSGRSSIAAVHAP
jgi:hypothetical protein